MKVIEYFCIGLVFIICVGGSKFPTNANTKPAKPWRAVHLLNYDTDADLEALGQTLPALAKQGINVIILEVDYNFAFKSHPELRRGDNPITRDGARKFTALCRKLNIRLIPEFQSLG